MSRRKATEPTTPKPWFPTITTCDLCGLETAPGHDWPSQTWYEQNETEITCTIGEVYPDGDDHRGYIRLDVCPKCFVDKLVPAVEERFGVKFARGKKDD